MSDINTKSIIIDYQEWVDLQHKIDILIESLVAANVLPCDGLSTVCDQNGENWCEIHCSDRDLTAKDCWHKFLKERVKRNDEL